MNQEPTYVELQFCPSPELIPIVRRFVSSFYERLLRQADMASRLALATHELLENTVKFSVDSISSIHLSFVQRGEETEVSIHTRNRASDADRAGATAIIDEIKSFSDPFDYYQNVMRKNAKVRDGSRLGLARISAEAEMELDYQVEGDELVVTARARLRGGPVAGPPEISEIGDASFAATSSFDGRALSVRLAGNADLGAQSVLESLLPRLHAEALRLGAREVVVDFTSLEFMNSSCFRSFVTWLSEVQDLPQDVQYRIRLRSNPTMLWQRRSLHALRCFAHELVSIET